MNIDTNLEDRDALFQLKKKKKKKVTCVVAERYIGHLDGYLHKTKTGTKHSLLPNPNCLLLFEPTQQIAKHPPPPFSLWGVWDTGHGRSAVMDMAGRGQMTFAGCVCV